MMDWRVPVTDTVTGETVFKIVQLTQLAIPWRGFRGVDPWGAGGFRAPRDGGSRLHNGIDILTLPGDEIVAPLEGVISRVGVAKGGTELGSIHITGTGDYEGWHLKIFYVSPLIKAGDTVKCGQKLGIAQDVAGYYHALHPQRSPNMKNHVHVELRMNVDPSRFMPSYDIHL